MSHHDCHVTCHIMIVMSHVTGVMSHLTYGANHCYCVVCLVCWHCTYQCWVCWQVSSFVHAHHPLCAVCPASLPAVLVWVWHLVPSYSVKQGCWQGRVWGEVVLTEDCGLEECVKFKMVSVVSVNVVMWGTRRWRLLSWVYCLRQSSHHEPSNTHWMHIQCTVG